jgi:hypothetical protein
VITVGFTYLFGLRSTTMHTMMVAALALTIALVLLTISALDYPLGVHSARRARRLPVGPAEDRTRLNSASFEKEHSVNSVTFGVLNAMHIVQKFEQLLNTHRRPDGSRWTSQRLEEATDGLVTRSYFVNLRKGRIENPGYEKMAAIAKAMGFLPGRGSTRTQASPRRLCRPAKGADWPAGPSTSSMPSGTRRRASLTPTQRSLA